MYNIIKQIIKDKESEIRRILSQIESENTITEEIRLSLNALEEENQPTKKLNQIASYLPMNLPLYSLITYVIVPSVYSRKTFYRPSSKTLEIAIKLYELLELSKYDIHLINETRKSYFEEYVQESSTVIFVGKPENAKKIEKRLGQDVLFLYFGVGQNPIVIEKDADIDLAVQKTAHAVLFNNGQDCAKPNAIFVNNQVSQSLIKKLIMEIKQNNAENYKLQDIENIQKTINLLLKERNHIIEGGKLDAKNLNLTPTIILKKFKYADNMFDEYYAPVFRIYVYDNVTDLKTYFSSDLFNKENMNISLFGTSNYITSLPNSIILDNCIVSEVDNGKNEFGGFGDNVSYIKYHGLKIHKPLLIKREIEYFYNNQNFKSYINSNNENSSLNEYLDNEFIRNIKEIFKDNLQFAFIFGSRAKRKIKRTSDIDILICINEVIENQILEFKEWYFRFHYLHGLKADKFYPGEIVTEEKLNQIILNSKNIKFSVYNSKEIFDAVFYTQIFNDKKRNITGDKNKISYYESQFQKIIKTWCNMIFELITTNGLVKNERDYMKCLFELSNNNLLFFSEKLKYEYNDWKENSQIIDELDDGLLKRILKY